MAKEKIDRKELAKICNARNTLCNFCENDACERCIVTQLVDDAYAEVEEAENDEEDNDDEDEY